VGLLRGVGVGTQEEGGEGFIKMGGERGGMRKCGLFMEVGRWVAWDAGRSRGEENSRYRVAGQGEGCKTIYMY
jgi:hypothetical protein